MVNIVFYFEPHKGQGEIAMKGELTAIIVSMAIDISKKHRREVIGLYVLRYLLPMDRVKQSKKQKKA